MIISIIPILITCYIGHIIMLSLRNNKKILPVKFELL